MHRFVGSAPDRIAGREFRLTKPLSEVFFYLAKYSLNPDLYKIGKFDHQRLSTLVGPDHGSYLLKKECRWFARRLAGWADRFSLEQLASKCENTVVARLVETAAGPKLENCTKRMLPKLLDQSLEELRQFLWHCGGFVVEVSGDEHDEGGKDCYDVEGLRRFLKHCAGFVVLVSEEEYDEGGKDRCHGGDPRFEMSLPLTGNRGGAS